jgi:hypothetical protein
MLNRPPNYLLSNMPVVTAVFPGTNVSVNKNIGDVTISASAGGGGGTQTLVDVDYYGSSVSPSLAPDYVTVSTLVLTLTAPSVITLSYGFATQSEVPTTLGFAVVVNGVTLASNVLKVILNDEPSSGSLSYWYRATASGVFTIQFRVTKLSADNVTISDIYSTALANLNG